MSKKLIIAIDDEADIRELLKFNLEKEGYDVITAADGNEGMEKINSNSPDLILLDVMIPGIDGHEVCFRLKKDPHLKNIPVIISSHPRSAKNAHG